jgi:hypothetical protein
MKNSISKLFLLTLCLILQSHFIFSQDLDPTNTAKGLFNYAANEGKNIRLGVGYESLLITGHNAVASDYAIFKPNTFLYFVAFTSSDRWLETNVFVNYELQIGKKTYTAVPTNTTEVSFLNCESYSVYFLDLPIQISIRHSLTPNIYWAFNPGMYFDFSIGSNTPELKNGALTKSIVIIKRDNNQDIKPLDIGLSAGIEFGIRAAYIALDFRTGLRNLAPDISTDLTIHNNATLYLSAGYRFGTPTGKSDADQVRKVIPH